MGDPAMLTTLARLQAELKNTSSANTTELTAIIVETSYDLAHRCNRDFYYASNFVENVSGQATPYLTVKRHTPIDITKPVSIVFDAALYDPNVYSISTRDARLGRIFNRTGWYWTALFLPNVQMDPFTGYSNPLYQVTYSGGFVTPQQALDNPTDPVLGTRTLPFDLERACLDWCVARWALRGQNPLLKSERLMSYSYQLANLEGLGVGLTGVPSVDAAIARYQRIGVSS